MSNSGVKMIFKYTTRKPS